MPPPAKLILSGALLLTITQHHVLSRVTGMCYDILCGADNFGAEARTSGTGCRGSAASAGTSLGFRIGHAQGQRQGKLEAVSPSRGERQEARGEGGYLTIFHDVDLDESRRKNGWEDTWKKRHTAGIMLLDAEDPGRIIGISKEPLMVPEADYEASNGFRNNVVFPAGAILEDTGRSRFITGLPIQWNAWPQPMWTICSGYAFPDDVRLSFPLWTALT